MADERVLATELGAVDDGSALTTGGLQSAIEACADAGGGEVVVPPGEYLTGTLVLADGVALRLAGGATLRASEHLEDDDADGAGAHLIVAHGAETVGVVGRGRIDLRGDAFWTRGEGGYEPDDRPSRLLRFSRCRDVHVDGVTIRNDVYGPNTDGIDVDACRDVRIADCEVMAGGADAVVGIEGRRSARITVAASDLGTGVDPVRTADGVPEDAVAVTGVR